MEHFYYNKNLCQLIVSENTLYKYMFKRLVVFLLMTV